jgi:hypothetical protein
MKIIITESQYKRILREEEEQKVLHIPSLKVFGNDWDQLQKFLKSKGNPPYTIGGNLYLGNTPIKSLGNLISIGGNLDLRLTEIESLGNLTSVGGDLNLKYTPLSKKYTTKEIRQMVVVGGGVYLGL